MKTPATFSAIIGLWPSAADFARDVGVSNVVSVRVWKHRDHIPSDKWAVVVKAADQRGFSGVTLELLASLAAKRAAA
jgi:hypothetical protein